tara:strand:+ start:178 stop:459 length:282 start_codon:yes stop_codon:yes gene_type:complete
MSDVQQAIEELVTEQVESRIDDAISDNYTINDLRSDVDDLQSRLDGEDHEEVVQAVFKQVIMRLMDTLDGNFVMVKKSYLHSLEESKEKKDVA